MVKTDVQQGFSGYAIVELMGHVRLAGKVSQEEQFGTKLGRIDIPQKDGSTVTQYFSGSSIYRLTPVSEEVARQVAIHCKPEPVHSWELPRQLTAPETEPNFDDLPEDWQDDVEPSDRSSAFRND